MDVQSSTGGSAVGSHDPFLADWERRTGRAAGATAGGQTGATPGGRPARAADDVESQYKRIYEDRVNPFADFNRCVRVLRWPWASLGLALGWPWVGLGMPWLGGCVGCSVEARSQFLAHDWRVTPHPPSPLPSPSAPAARREKQKRYANLSAAEKITLNSTRFFISNKIARTFVFFYAVGLHALVFATLYHFTSTTHKHDC
jgi:hypothetical protein